MSVRLIISIILVLSGFATSSALEPWGLVKLSVAHVRSNPAHSSEMVTQATMGTPIKLLDEQTDWFKVELPDGYIGWISRWSIEPMSDYALQQWQQADRAVVVGKGHHTATSLSEIETGSPISDLDRLDIVEIVSSSDSVMIVKTPDGRIGTIPADEVVDMKEFFGYGNSDPIMPNPETIIGNALDMMGRVYLWGGTSFKMTDCSGLTRICYMMNGILLPRDASPQSEVGKTVTLAEAQPGDLVFFANNKGRVNHVGIYIGDKQFIHSSGQVKINSLDPTAPNRYHKQPYVIKHIESSDIPGVQKICSHPWYFL